MDLSHKAQRLQKYKSLGMFLWKHGHDDMMQKAGLDEWLWSHGISPTTPATGNGNGNGTGNYGGNGAAYSATATSVGLPAGTIVQNNKTLVGDASKLPADKTAEIIADLRSLGPTYIRIAQILARRPDILPLSVADFLSSIEIIQEPMTLSELDSTIRSELELPLMEIYPTFDPTPITVSPFDQTHSAVLKDGRKVIVKVQKPGIREIVYDDLSTLEEVAEFCDHHTRSGKQISFKAIVEELKKTLLVELDYRQEFYNLEHLQESLKSLDHIVVPDPLKRYSTERVLTLKFIDGRKLRDSTQLGLLAAEKARLAGEIFHTYLQQILVNGFVHGDPNPDNILFTSTGKLALLDLGVVTRVSNSMQEKLLQILMGINEGRGEHVADLIVNFSNKRGTFDEDAFKQAVEDLVLIHRDVQADGLEIGRVFLGISQAAFRYGMAIPFEFGTLGTTLINLDKVADLLDKDFDSRKFLERNVTEIMRGHVMRTLTPAHIFQNILESVELLEKLPGKVGKILDAVANNELKVEVDAIDEKLLMSGFQKIANRITMGLVLAALIMGASQLMQIKSTFVIWGYPGIAIICFILAATCGFGLVLEIFISDRNTNKSTH
jgi:predicted unusual protein kinase regulating ubiquinone biosynthesis (AarF/ABC1/UbiB family)